MNAPGLLAEDFHYDNGEEPRHGQTNDCMAKEHLPTAVLSYPTWRRRARCRSAETKSTESWCSGSAIHAGCTTDRGIFKAQNFYDNVASSVGGDLRTAIRLLVVRALQTSNAHVYRWIRKFWRASHREFRHIGCNHAPSQLQVAESKHNITQPFAVAVVEWRCAGL